MISYISTMNYKKYLNYFNYNLYFFSKKTLAAFIIIVWVFNAFIYPVNASEPLAEDPTSQSTTLVPHATTTAPQTIEIIPLSTEMTPWINRFSRLLSDLITVDLSLENSRFLWKLFMQHMPTPAVNAPGYLHIKTLRNVCEVQLIRSQLNSHLYIHDLTTFLDGFRNKVNTFQQQRTYQGLLRTREDYQGDIDSKQREYQTLCRELENELPSHLGALDTELSNILKSIKQMLNDQLTTLNQLLTAKDRYERAVGLKTFLSVLHNLAPIMGMGGNAGKMAGALIEMGDNFGENFALKDNPQINADLIPNIHLEFTNPHVIQEIERRRILVGGHLRAEQVIQHNNGTQESETRRASIGNGITVEQVIERRPGVDVAAQRNNRIQQGVQAAAGVARAGLDIYEQIHHHQEQCERFDGQINIVRNNIMQLENAANNMNETVRDNLQVFVQIMQNTSRNFQGRPVGQLILMDYRLSDKIDDIMVKFEKFESQMKTQSNMAGSLQKVKNCMHVLSNINKEITRYEEHKQFANYLFKLQSANFTHNDNNMQKLQAELYQYEVLRDYQDVVNIFAECQLAYGRIPVVPTILTGSLEDRIRQIPTFIEQMCNEWQGFRSELDVGNAHNVSLNGHNNGIVWSTTYERDPELVTQLLKGEATYIFVDPNNFQLDLPRFTYACFELIHRDDRMNNTERHHMTSRDVKINLTKIGQNITKFGDRFYISNIGNPPLLSYQWDGNPFNDVAIELNNMRYPFSSPLGSWIVQYVDSQSNRMSVLSDDISFKGIEVRLKVKGKALRSAQLPPDFRNRIQSSLQNL